MLPQSHHLIATLIALLCTTPLLAERSYNKEKKLILFTQTENTRTNNPTNNNFRLLSIRQENQQHQLLREAEQVRREREEQAKWESEFPYDFPTFFDQIINVDKVEQIIAIPFLGLYRLYKKINLNAQDISEGPYDHPTIDS